MRIYFNTLIKPCEARAAITILEQVQADLDAVPDDIAYYMTNLGEGTATEADFESLIEDIRPAADNMHPEPRVVSLNDFSYMLLAGAVLHAAKQGMATEDLPYVWDLLDRTKDCLRELPAGVDEVTPPLATTA